MHIVFSHGKESGPWGSKISYLADIAKQQGHSVDSIDYRQSLDPEWRVQHLLESVAADDTETVLVGSSMGAYVATLAAQQIKPKGLFLMAPAFYLPGYTEQNPQPPSCPVAIVHGWNDAVVPVENAIRFAQLHRCDLQLINSDHGLNHSLKQLGELFALFMADLQ